MKILCKKKKKGKQGKANDVQFALCGGEKNGKHDLFFTIK
jgi:hypothetical protein